MYRTTQSAKGRWTTSGLVLVLAFAIALATTRVEEAIDLAILDTQQRVLFTYFRKPVQTPVVVAGIDESTLEAYAEPLALWHAHLGNFFKAMALAKPEVVGVDLVLPDRSYDALVPGLDRVAF